MTTRTVYCSGLSNQRILQKLEDYVPEREKTILAEGDSWFAITTPFDRYPTNVLKAMHLRRRTAIIDVSHSGEKATDMARGDGFRQLAEILGGQPAIKINAMLLSAGGNDVIERVEELIGEYRGRVLQQNIPEKELRDLPRLLAFLERRMLDVLGDVESSIRRLCDLRTGQNRDTPVIIHGYAHVTPRDAPARLFSEGRGVRGPWLKTRLDDLGIHDPAMQRSVALHVIDIVNEFYKSRIAEPAITGVHYVDLRPLVAAANLEDVRPTGDWNDEMHPGTDSLKRINSSAYAPLLDEWFQ